MIVSGPVGNPESSSVHKRSPKSINQSLNSKFLGLSLSTGVWLSTLDAGILIRVYQLRLMIFSLNMVDYSMSFLLLSFMLKSYWWGGVDGLNDFSISPTPLGTN